MEAGRPLKFETVAELQQKIEEYFNKCRVKERPLTVSGLAVHLKTSRETLLNYEKRDEFFDTIKEAKDLIECYAEEQLFTNPRTGGIIFNLVNNWGWKNKTESDVRHQVEIDGFEYKVPDETDSTSHT